MLRWGDPSQTTRGTCPTLPSPPPLRARTASDTSVGKCSNAFLGGVDGNGGVGDGGFKFTTGNEVIVFVCVRRSEVSVPVVHVRHVLPTHSS